MPNLTLRLKFLWYFVLIPLTIAFSQPKDTNISMQTIQKIDPNNVITKSNNPPPQTDPDKIAKWLTRHFFKVYKDVFQETLSEAAKLRFSDKFRYAGKTNFDVLAVISHEQTLLQFVVSKTEPKIKIERTNLDPQIRFHEIYQERDFSDGKTVIVGSAIDSSIFKIQGEIEISGDNSLDGPITPYKLEKSAIVSIIGKQRWLFTETVLKENESSDVFQHQTILEGHTILLGSSLSKKSVERTAIAIFNFELQSLYFDSEQFRMAIIHPLLKETAESILKKANNSKEIEYPLWAFLDDLKKVSQLSKLHQIEDSYVEQLINKQEIIEQLQAQYNPMGTLLIHYRTRAGFMLQWGLINSVLLFLSLIVVVGFPNIGDGAIGYLALFFVAVNSFVISKQPENFTWFYWLLPLIIFVLCMIVVYRHNLLNVINGKSFFAE